MSTQKLYNRFHVGKNGIRVGDFQKMVFFPNIQLKAVVNRLHLFQNLPDHRVRIIARKKKTCSKFSIVYYLQICMHDYTFCYYHC